MFEVNASSCRNGKRILAQLQEATQSHQVSKTSVGGSNTPVKLGKWIMAQLQEATQSHQVSKTSVGGSNTPVKLGNSLLLCLLNSLAANAANR